MNLSLRSTTFTVANGLRVGVRLAALSPDRVRDVARRYLDPRRMITVIAGESAPIEALLIA